MPLLSWFSYSSTETDAVKNDQNDESGQLTATATNQQPMDFDAIVERVEAMKSELAYAHELCEQANLQFEKYRLDIQELKQSLSIERRSNAVLKETLNVERKNCAALRVQANVDKQEIKRQKVITTQLQARLSTEIASLKAMTQHARTIEQRYAEAQFDLEYLKCITDADRLMQSPTTENKDAPLPALPFVVVLVDGDAYSWSRDIFSTEMLAPRGRQVEPGGLAATKIKNEVTKYIMNQNGRIPFTSKIISRVFCNYGDSEGRMLSKQRARGTAVGLRDFAVQFTERMPLFDFFDAGRGKERADDKIRENFHLFLSTPNCHAVFVAACTDNGFARMLEQYADHPFAYDKIILVSPGLAASEIEKLHFKHVVWPSVFGLRAMSKEEAFRRETTLRKQRVAKGFAYKGVFSRNFVRDKPIDFRHLLMAMVPKGSVAKATSTFSQSGGVLVKESADCEAGSRARSVTSSSDEDVD